MGEGIDDVGRGAGQKQGIDEGIIPVVPARDAFDIHRVALLHRSYIIQGEGRGSTHPYRSRGYPPGSIVPGCAWVADRVTCWHILAQLCTSHTAKSLMFLCHSANPPFPCSLLIYDGLRCILTGLPTRYKAWVVLYRSRPYSQPSLHLSR